MILYSLCQFEKTLRKPQKLGSRNDQRCVNLLHNGFSWKWHRFLVVSLTSWKFNNPKTQGIQLWLWETLKYMSYVRRNFLTKCTHSISGAERQKANTKFAGAGKRLFWTFLSSRPVSRHDFVCDLQPWRGIHVKNKLLIRCLDQMN